MSPARKNAPRTFPVAVLTIGNEILSGRTLDTNFHVLAQAVAETGAEIVWHASCRDVVGEIVAALHVALRSAKLVVVSGGLGPTPDDLTRKAIAQVCERPLVLDDEALRQVRARFESRGIAMRPINEVQALLPQDAQVIPNSRGSAPGFLISHKLNFLIALPGVPWELEQMTRDFVAPWLAKHAASGGTRHLVLRTVGIAESALAEKLAGFEGRLPTGAGLAYLPHGTGVDLRVSFRGAAPDLEDQCQEVREQLLQLAGDVVYGEGEVSLEEVVGALLHVKGLKLALAESCTGGLICERITRVPGSSAWLERGFVTYSNQAKQDLLGVGPETLAAHGAVSSETASEMARGARTRAGVDIALAVTGIAGPTGGSVDKPLGLVFIGLDAGGATVVNRYQFIGERDLVRARAATAALDLLRRHLLGLPGRLA